MKKILIYRKKLNLTEVILNDKVAWNGYVENHDTLEDILSSLGFDVDFVDHGLDDDNVDLPEESEYYDPRE